MLQCAEKKFFLYRIALHEQKTPDFLQTKSLLFTQTVPYSHQKHSFSTLRRPFQRPLTYCLQRIQPFFCCSLNPLRCKAGASHRFKSLPAIPGEVAAFRKTGYLMNAGHFRFKNASTGDLNRGSQGFAPCAFWFFLHNAKRINPFPFREASRFCKPRISTPQ